MVAGHLQIKKDKYYMVLELKDEYGKRKTKWVSTGLPTKGNKRKAEAMLEEARINYQAKIVKDESKVLFSEYMQNWLVRVRPNLEESTYAAYQATVEKRIVATVYKGNIIKNLIMDCQSYTKYRPNETTGGIFVSWRRKEELPTGA